MALTTYAELQSSIADFLNREDLASVIPTFIDLAEAQINRDVRHYQMETVATLSIEGRYTLRPINWVETVSITLDGGSANNLELLSTSAMNERRSNSGNTAGSPRYYKNTGQDIEVWPSPDQAESATYVYLARVPSLGVSVFFGQDYDLTNINALSLANALVGANGPVHYVYSYDSATGDYLVDASLFGIIGDAAITRYTPEEFYAQFGSTLTPFQSQTSQQDSAPTNWLLSAAPDVYLYGSLLQSAPYLANDERIGVWAQLYSAAVLRLNEESESAKYSGSGLGMRVKGLDTGRSANYWRDR
tara:strand:- start:1224 stop:2132 length:909 start_codon:yes stop_codon:yes gene_type:complete